VKWREERLYQVILGVDATCLGSFHRFLETEWMTSMEIYVVICQLHLNYAV